MRELLERLQAMQDTFSPSKKSVAEYVLKHYEYIPFQTISQIATLTSTSEATISKLCKELGFNGFAELKNLIGQSVNSSLTMNRKLVKVARDLNESSLLESVLDNEILNIQSTLRNEENARLIPKAISLIDSAKHVYTIGGRTSAFFAGLFAFKLRQQDINVSHIDWGIGDYIEKVMMIRPGDLVIAFSFSRFTKNTVKILKLLKEKNVSIILITGEGLSPAYQYANLVFVCRTDFLSYVASYTACLSLINAILVARAVQHKEHVEKYLSELESNFELFDIFTD